MTTKADILYDAAIVNARALSVESVAASVEFLFPGWADDITTTDIRRHIARVA